MSYRFIDLFAGIGGFRIAFDNNGAKFDYLGNLNNVKGNIWDLIIFWSSRIFSLIEIFLYMHVS